MADRDTPSISKVHKEFLSERMGDKPVTALPGIGNKYGERLVKKGFGKAYKVFGMFLTNDKDFDKFSGWLMSTSGAKEDCIKDCFNCLKEYDENFN